MIVKKTSRLALLISLPLAAANTKVYNTIRLSGPIAMDGRLDEAAWQGVQPLNSFTQSHPKLGSPSQKKTEIRLLYDDHYLYLGASLHHAPGSTVRRQVHRRDQNSNSDWFSVYIDSTQDRRSAFIFAVNASNVQKDGLLLEDNTEDLSWDGVWESAVASNGSGWSVEIRIPLSILPFHEGGKQAWGINFMRQDEGSQREISYWHPCMRDDKAWTSHFPHLQGIDDIKPQMRRDFIPYISTQRKFKTSEIFDDRKWTHRLGLDANIGINNYSQINLTIRPDFGQVEVDQAVLNLSTVETFLKEKRPFFLEGMDIFNISGVNLFYSRRLGKGLGTPLTNSTMANYPEDITENIVDFPRAVEINAAGKYTSKTPGGFSLGLLAAGMEGATFKYINGDGFAVREDLVPRTTAFVARAMQSIGTQGSRIGAFLAYAKESSLQRRRSQVGAIDSTWKSESRQTSVEALYSWSDTGPRETRRHGDFMRLRANVAFGHGWALDGNIFSASKKYNPNYLGYIDRPDKKGLNLDIAKYWDEEFGIFRNPILHFTYTDYRDQEGRRWSHLGDCWIESALKNESSCYVGCQMYGAVHDDMELRTFQAPVKKYLRVPSSPVGYLGAQTPINGMYRATLTFSRALKERGEEDDWNLQLSAKPLPNLEITLGTRYFPSSGQWRWLENQGEIPIVGIRSLKQLDQTLRISYAFSPTFTIQCFSQWLAANWHFDDLHSYINENTLEGGAISEGPAAFSERLWNLNLITRWEFKAGSCLYLVYTHGVFSDALINERGSLSPMRDLSLLRHLPSDDTVQMKLSWLFR